MKPEDSSGSSKNLMLSFYLWKAQTFISDLSGASLDRNLVELDLSDFSPGLEGASRDGRASVLGYFVFLLMPGLPRSLEPNDTVLTACKFSALRLSSILKRALGLKSAFIHPLLSSSN